MESKPVALVVDLSYQVHRSLSMPNLAGLRNKDHVPTGGIFGVLRSLDTTLKEFRINKVVCCMDSYPAFRKQVFPSYKESRRSNPDSPEYEEYHAKDEFGWSQYGAVNYTFDELHKLLPRMKIPCIIQENIEGDDLVYHTCKNLHDKGFEIIAMSDDKDYLQLVNLIPGCTVYRPVAKQKITAENFMETQGVDPKWFIYAKAAEGDDSDDIPRAFNGVGEGFKKLVNEATANGIEDNDDCFEKLLALSQDPKFDWRVHKVDAEGMEKLKFNLSIMDFRKCPYSKANEEELDTILSKVTIFDFDYVIQKFKEWEFKSLSGMLTSNKITSLM